MALHLNNAAGERNLVMHCADLKPLFAQARRGPKIMPRIIVVYQYVLFRVLCDEKMQSNILKHVGIIRRYYC